VSRRPRGLAVCPDAIEPITSHLENIEINGTPLTVIRGTPDKAELIQRLEGFQGALTSEGCVDDDVLAACPDLSVIVFLGTGASAYIDVEACRRRGVTLRTVSGYGNRVVAEHALALMFAVYRDLATQHESMRSGGWKEGSPIGELHGKTLGVVGTGGVGAELCAIGRALGMKVISWARTPSDSRGESELDTLLETADVVSLHLALNEDTRNFLDRERMRRMKRGAVLINTARAALVDEVELAAMLADGHSNGAGLDVYSSEPLPPDHPLRSSPHVVMSCHTAWRSPEAVERLVRTGVSHLADELSR
jgi:D-3-phosphoglycerate dehydrogenase